MDYFQRTFPDYRLQQLCIERHGNLNCSTINMIATLLTMHGVQKSQGISVQHDNLQRRPVQQQRTPSTAVRPDAKHCRHLSIRLRNQSTPTAFCLVCSSKHEQRHSPWHVQRSPIVIRHPSAINSATWHSSFNHNQRRSHSRTVRRPRPSTRDAPYIIDSTLRLTKSPLRARPIAFDRQAPYTGTSSRDNRYATDSHRSVACSSIPPHHTETSLDRCQSPKRRRNAPRPVQTPGTSPTARIFALRWAALRCRRRTIHQRPASVDQQMSS